MQFSCGKTLAQKEAERLNAAIRKYNRLSQWHKRFAWLPQTIDERDRHKLCIWLETYECRVYPHTPVAMMDVLRPEDWEYRLPEKKEN